MRDILFRKRVVELEKKVMDGSYSEHHTPDENLSEKLFFVNYYSKKILPNTMHDPQKCDCFDRYKKLVGRYVLLGGDLLQETITLSVPGDGTEKKSRPLIISNMLARRIAKMGKEKRIWQCIRVC